ncbi:hypothetical protein BHE74_00032307 [Ensete ventricosum]|nr:hypothetical protein BHE74_00032307 [Ensete ventricosum]
MKSHSERRDKRRYCRFHREYDHDMEECRDLQYQIKDLIRCGHLRRYVRDQSSLPETRRPDPKVRLRSKSTSSSEGQPRAVTAPRRARPMHDLRSGRGRRMMKTSTSPSSREARKSRSKTLMVSFMVVKLSSVYNAIIGRPTLNRLKAVVSTYHRLPKFPTRARVGEVRSDPRESRQCYLTTTILSKKPKVQSATTVPQNLKDSARDPHSTEQVLEVPLDPSRPNRLVKACVLLRDRHVAGRNSENHRTLRQLRGVSR